MPRERVVGVMSHLATADEADEAFAREQIERFREVAAAFPGRDRAPGEQRRRPAVPGGALRRRPLRRCALRAVALRRRPRGPRARAGARLAELRRARARARTRARAPATAAASSPRGRRASASSPWGTPTGSAAVSPARRCSSTAPGAGSSGTISMDAFAVELEGRAGRRGGDPDRRRRSSPRSMRASSARSTTRSPAA